jgi:hypothetical protein
MGIEGGIGDVGNWAINSILGTGWDPRSGKRVDLYKGRSDDDQAANYQA